MAVILSFLLWAFRGKIYSPPVVSTKTPPPKAAPESSAHSTPTLPEGQQKTPKTKPRVHAPTLPKKLESPAPALLIGPGAQVTQNSAGATNSPNIIAGGPVTINPVPPPPCTLTKDQHDTLVASIKQSGPPHSTAVRHPEGSMASQQCADQLSSAIQDAGWTVNPHPKFLIWEREATGIWVMVEDMNKPPACAIILQQALKTIHIDAPGFAVPGMSAGNEPCKIVVGGQK